MIRSDFGQNVTAGILHPALMHKFRFIIGSETMTKLITMQTTRVQIDVVNETLEVHVEQPVGHSQEMLDLIHQISRKRYPFSLDMMDGGEGVLSSITGVAKMIEHCLAFDYSVSETAQHRMKFQYIPTMH